MAKRFASHSVEEINARKKQTYILVMPRYFTPVESILLSFLPLMYLVHCALFYNPDISDNTYEWVLKVRLMDN
jgi:hypothetical protein